MLFKVHFSSFFDVVDDVKELITAVILANGEEKSTRTWGRT